MGKQISDVQRRREKAHKEHIRQRDKRARRARRDMMRHPVRSAGGGLLRWLWGSS